MRLKTGKIQFLLVFFLLFTGVIFGWGVKLFPSTALAGRIKNLVETEMSGFLTADVQINEVGLFFFARSSGGYDPYHRGKPVLTAGRSASGWTGLNY